jgi:hypothetical protein
LLAEIPSWAPRLSASLRAEGLSPTALPSLTDRSLEALRNALTDPNGCWILSPQPSAHSEQALRLAASTELRVDRTFLAGPTPLSTGTSHLWIVDFKTTDQGSRTDALFEAQEREKYSAQLESYARAQAVLPGAPANIILGLYYPLVTTLISWDSVT